MKTPNTTDHIFRERLGEYASEVPAGLWEAIEAKRPQRKPLWWRIRRSGGMIFIGGIMLVALLFFGIEKPKHKLAFKALGALQIDILKNKTALTVISNENKQKTVHSNTMKQPPEEQGNTFQKSPITLKTDVLQNTLYTLSLNAEKIIQSTDNQLIVDENKVTKNAVNDPALAAVNAPPKGILVQQQELGAIPSLPLTELALAKRPDPCYKFNNKDNQKKIRPRFYLDALVAPVYAHRSLSPVNGDWDGYAIYRDSTERNRLSFGASLRASVVLGKVAFRTGLSYQQINERFDFVNGYEERLEVNNVLDSQGNIISSDTVLVTGTRIKTTYNRLHLIDIPFILGYEVRDRNWTLSVNGGAFLNVFFQQKGDFFDPNLQLASFSSKAENAYPIFRKSVGISLFGSMGIHYKISDRWHLTAEPHFRYYLDSFTGNDYPLKQNYWTAGLSIGARLQLR